MSRPEDTRTYAVMAKPAGSACNLRCTYCYYLDKTPAPRREAFMSDGVLAAYIEQNLAMHGKDATVEFAWHGGEPTLCGVAFFRRAVELEKRYGAGRRIKNSLQTNATLLDEEWCRFFKENDFIVGVSVDGPKALHDRFRTDACGAGSFDAALRGVELLRRHGVEYNTLTTVNAANAENAEEVYGFLREISDYMQFLPVVESSSSAMPPGLAEGGFYPAEREMAAYSVSPGAYGDFLCRVFDCWRSRDVGVKFIQTVEAVLGNMMEKPAGVCVHEPACGHAASLEVDGSLYSCDRYPFAAYRLGNVMETPLRELMESNRDFGLHKAELADECLGCEHLGLCWGGCPKDRLSPASGNGGKARHKNYLCAGYRKFFTHMRRTVRIS